MSDSDKATEKWTLLEHTAKIVSAYAGNAMLSPPQLIEVIATVSRALGGLGATPVAPKPEELIPAVPIKKSVSSNFIVCLEDGKKLKMLKRHLMSSYDMTPAAYREKWGLPRDYPMVAPNYAATRSQLAKKMGLGKIHTAAAPARAAKPRRETRPSAQGCHRLSGKSQRTAASRPLRFSYIFRPRRAPASPPGTRRGPYKRAAETS